MSGWKYISIIVLILLGGTVYFGYWALSQYNLALDTYGASYSQLGASFAAYSKNVLDRTTATTTDSLEISTTTPQAISTTTPIIISASATSTPLETPFLTGATEVKLSFIFPKKNNEVYIGCTYQIPLQASTTIHLLGAALIDAGTRETIGPIASGLAKENAIEKNSQNLKWKVGVVWPGRYYLKISKINGSDTEIKSKVFEINKMPVDISTDEQKKICKESGT